MDKSDGVPKDVSYERQPGIPPAFGNYNQPPQPLGAPPAYSECGVPQSGPIPPGQGYVPYGQGNAHPGQGYLQPMPGYGYPQQQYQHTNVVVAQPLIQNQVVTGPLPPDHMCAAIFVTLCCFWPTGIVAIMRASDARSAISRGDVASATAHASSAKSMVTISVVIGIMAYVMIAVIIGVYVGVVLKNINDNY